MQLHMLKYVGERGTADAIGSKILRRKDGMLLSALVRGGRKKKMRHLLDLLLLLLKHLLHYHD